jgi:hypothetical protein
MSKILRLVDEFGIHIVLWLRLTLLIWRDALTKTTMKEDDGRTWIEYSLAGEAQTMARQEYLVG